MVRANNAAFKAILAPAKRARVKFGGTNFNSKSSNILHKKIMKSAFVTGAMKTIVI